MREQKKGWELSNEETDLLERSKKKAKSNKFDVERVVDEVMKDSSVNVEVEMCPSAKGDKNNRKPVLYRDRLLGINGYNIDEIEKEEMMQEDQELEKEEDTKVPLDQ